MKYFITIIFFVISNLLLTSAREIHVCTNGIFKCVSPNSLRICLTGQLISSELFCPTGTYCSETSSTICTNSTLDLDTEELTYYSQCNCTESGIFPMDNSGCQRYYQCVKMGNSFMIVRLKCYIGYFDPILKVCTVDYMCPETSSNVPQCTQEGKIPFPNTKCQNYVLCKNTPNGFLSEVKYCISGSFNSNSAQCEQNYVCPEINEPSVPSISTGTTTSSTTTTLTTSTSTESTVKPNNTIIPTQQPCKQQGKFVVPNTGCKKYKWCILTTNGFAENIHECPNGLLFDPILQQCSKGYVCQSGTITEETNTPIIETTTKRHITTTTINESSTISECTKPEIVPYTGCTKYMICRITSHGLVQQIMSCPTGTFFDPLYAVCSKNYLCNESAVTSTELTVSKNPECNLGDVNPVANTNCTKYLRCSLTSNGIFQEVLSCPVNTLFDPVNQECSEDFICPENVINSKETSASTVNFEQECTAHGKFPIFNTYCSKYINCLVTTHGFFKMVLECTSGKYFDPTVKECTEAYICPEIAIVNTVSTIGTTSSSSECKQQGSFAVPNTECKNFTRCILTTNGFQEIQNECPNGTLFDPMFQQCSKFYVCRETTTNGIIKTTTPIKNEVEKCTNIGRIPSLGTYCKKYILCVSTTHGFKGKEYECPNGTFFNPDKGRCLTNYQCSEIETTTSISTIEDVSKMCTSIGKIPVIDEDCKKYILCSKTSTGFKGKEYECPNGTFFSPEKARCLKNYQCGEVQTTSSISTIEDVSKNCTAAGKIPAEGENCTKYILCAKTSTGYKGKIYECPNGYFFDPNKKRCDNYYQCKPNIQTTTPIDISTELITTTEIIPTPVIPQCVVEGRLAVPGLNCKQYILCVKTKNGYVSAEYSCPEKSLFNPKTMRCSTNYTCEDNTIRCSTIGNFPNEKDSTCKYYYSCVVQDDYIQAIGKQCNKDQLFDPEIQRCTHTYSCRNKLSRLRRQNNVVSPRFLVNGQCTTVGRYLVQLTNCKNYVYCSVNTDGTLKGTNFTCPTTTVFNQAIQKCASPSSYTCPDSFCVNNPGLISWANPNIKDCTSYIVCQQILDTETGIILGNTGVVNYCPTGKRFNPNLQICDDKYVCPTING